MIKLKAKLDKIFSEYIRLRDADPAGNVRCISCGKILFWKNSDCGHYINRRHLSLRFNETNCNAQCRFCNRFDEGNMAGYTKGLIQKYGENIIDRLLIAKDTPVKITNTEYQLLIQHYQQEIKRLHKEKKL